MNRRLTWPSALLTAACLAVVGCSEAPTPQTEQSAATTEKPATTPANVAQVPVANQAAVNPHANPHAAAQSNPHADPHAGMSGAAQPAAANVGKVVSVAQVPPYTYVEVDQGGRTLWLAGNHVELQQGQLVRWGRYALMRNFKSKSLNRTFDEILFVDSIMTGGTQPAAAVSAQAEGKVVNVMNAAGYSYIEVDSQGNRKWLAAPQSEVAVGDTVSWSGGNTMRNFASRSLNRSFDQIDFVAGVTVNP